MTRSACFPEAEGPAARREPRTDTHHGVERTDDYAWLRAENWRKVLRDPAALASDIREHLAAENAHMAALMAGTEVLQAELVAEMRGRIKEDDASVPLPDGSWAYGTAHVEGGQHPRLVRVPTGGGAEEVLVDGDAEAEGRDYFRLGGTAHSHDHARLAWSFDGLGSEHFTIRVRALATGIDLPDAVERTKGRPAWTADGGGFLYVALDEDERPSRVMLHALGTPQAEDRLVYEERDPGFFAGIGATRDGRWAIVTAGDHETSEARLLPLDRPDAEPVLVAPRSKGVEYEMVSAGEEFFVVTNEGGATDFKVMTAPADAPGRASWTELVPHVPGRLIVTVMAFERFLVRLEREGGLPRIVVRERAGGEEHPVAFDEEAYALSLAGAYEYDTTTLRFVYSSMTTPRQTWDYDMATRERTLLKTQEVPSGHDPAHYVTRRLHAPSQDGAMVPVSVLHRRDVALDGSASCLLYGYGAYGIALPASFSTERLSLVDRGWVYAIAHVRGGEDLGRAWYEDGKREKKPNTFHDFVAAGRHLAAEGFAAHDRLVAEGGSAGGMLMGAVANMAPGDWAGVVAHVPFVDVLTTMLDDTLPLTPPEWPEWGNPIASAEDYRTIAAYSPYDNVGEGPYPPILALAGLTDPRVTYWEPAKWIARLRRRAAGGPFLLKTNMGAGHGGASGRFARLEEVALAQAFALRAVGRA